MKPQLIYVGDPMCSWCWGISNEVTKLKDSFADKTDFKLLLGGLRPYETKVMDKEMAEFIRHHWDQVHERTKQPFAYDLLERTNFIYDTEPPSRAILVAKKLNSDIGFDFYKAVQKAFYAENKDTNELSTYIDIAADFELDIEQFETLYHSDEIKEEVKQGFKYTRDIGANSFPTILLLKDEKLELIARGYATFEMMSNNLKRLL